MAGRIRTIKPEILDDEVAAGLSDAAWRLWVSLWVLADDHGDVRAGEKYLAANVWQDTSKDAATPLAELIAKGRLHPYSVGGQRYARIHAWAKHQRVDNAGKPRVPPLEEDDGVWNQELGDRFAATRGEPPRVSEIRGSRDTRARIPAARPPTSDLRPPTPTTERVADAPPLLALSGEPTRSKSLAAGRGSRGTRIPADWTPNAATVATVESLGVDAHACVEEFRDHWLAEGGSKASKCDWNAAFRKRVRDLLDWGRAPMLPPRAPAEPASVTPDPNGIAKVHALLAAVEDAKRLPFAEGKG